MAELTFGKLLKIHRDSAYSQAKLAKTLGVSRNTIGNWERGISKPDHRDIVLEIGRVLALDQIETDQLLDAAGYQRQYNHPDTELIPMTPVQLRTERTAESLEATDQSLQETTERLENVAEKITASPHHRLTPSPLLPPTDLPHRPTIPLRTRIPDPRTNHLVGRDGDLAWLIERLKAGDVAALAGVRGIGGIGKTELAIAAVRKLESHFEDHIIWLDCGPNDVYAIQSRMAAALGIELTDDDLRIRADALARAWRTQPSTLVVLDDIRRRHVADFNALLPPRPPCALLVTTRRHDLDLPREALRSLEVLDHDAALALLTDLLPDGWAAQEPDTLAGLANLLEYIPLALTLAANRAQKIADQAAKQKRLLEAPLAVMLADFKQRRLQMLDQGDRADISVRITFDASYEDLDDADQTRLARLGVFDRNEFFLPAIQAIWEDEERPCARCAPTAGERGFGRRSRGRYLVDTRSGARL